MKKALKGAWEIIKEPARDNSQVALAIAAIVSTSAAGCAVAFMYGILARDCGFLCAFAGGFLALIAAAASFSVGGMLGLLFGAPNWGGSTPRASAKKDGEKAPPQAENSGELSVRPNTSLERIADWLTTMIVGLSLVHLSTIETKATDLGIWLTRAVSMNNTTLNGTPGLVLALAFAFAGFLLVYLWSLRFLPSEIRASYSDLKAAVQEVGKTQERLEKTISYTTAMLQEFKNKPIFKVPEWALKEHGEALRTAGIDDGTRDEILRRYAEVSRAVDEPMREFGPSVQGRYKLSAAVNGLGAGKYQAVVKLDADPEKPDGKVIWLLHNSFSPEVISSSPIVAGASSYVSTIDEAFWIGAVVPIPGAEAIRLAFDLSKAEGSTEQFRAAGSPDDSAVSGVETTRSSK